MIGTKYRCMQEEARAREECAPLTRVIDALMRATFPLVSNSDVWTSTPVQLLLPRDLAVEDLLLAETLVAGLRDKIPRYQAEAVEKLARTLANAYRWEIEEGPAPEPVLPAEACSDLDYHWYEDVPEEGAEQPLLNLLRHIRALGREPTWYGSYEDPQLLLGPLVEERKPHKGDPLSVDHWGCPVKRRERPRTVTRGLGYVISPHFPRLRRLQREWEKSHRWHSSASCQMLDGQCESLYYRVYGQRCCYGPLPSGPDYRFLLK